MRKTVAALCAACVVLGGTGWAGGVSPSPAALAQAVTLAELKEQIPERLRMEVVTDAGETVTVDAPIALPEGEVMPVAVVKRATFNTLGLRERYPLPKGRDRYFYGASEGDEAEVCGSLSLYQEEKQWKISGKVDYSKRYALPEGSRPPENETSVDEIMDFLFENIQRYHCDAALDIRLERAVAMSGLCQMKRQKVTDGSGVSWTEFVANPDKPLKSGSKGSWSLRLGQYMYGARILDTYQPYGAYNPPQNPNWWHSPIFLYAEYLDGKNHDLGIWAVKEVQILREDASLLPYEDVVERLAKRIREGKLKSIYGLNLAYSLRIVKGDSFLAENGFDFNLHTRFVLVPEWQILGFDEKDAATAKSVGYDQPSREAILDPKNHSRYEIVYELRMDAATGEFILDDESMEYELDKEEE